MDFCKILYVGSGEAEKEKKKKGKIKENKNILSTNKMSVPDIELGRPNFG